MNKNLKYFKENPRSSLHNNQSHSIGAFNHFETSSLREFKDRVDQFS